MVENTIIRNPTEEERRDFTNIGQKEETAEVKFKKELIKHEKEATKNFLPFAARVATDEFYDYFHEQAKIIQRKEGWADISKIKPLKLDWKKYSDLKNFELVNEEDRHDPDLTKKNPGLNIFLKTKTYKFKGYSNNYVVQEDPQEAIARARKSAK